LQILHFAKRFASIGIKFASCETLTPVSLCKKPLAIAQGDRWGLVLVPVNFQPVEAAEVATKGFKA